METEKVNPLFQIAIRGDETIANEIHKFFALRGATNIHDLTFAYKNDVYFAVMHPDSNNILIGCTSDEECSRKIVSLCEAKKIMQKWEESLRQPKQKRRERKIHKSNCVNQVRFTVTDQLGNVITVSGKYAYEWTISINKDGVVIQTSFENRRKALNELKRLTGKRLNK